MPPALLARAGDRTAEPGGAWRLDGRTVLLFVLGAAIVVLLSSLPVIGWLVKLVVVVLGFGAVLWALWRRSEPAPPEPVAAA